MTMLSTIYENSITTMKPDDFTAILLFGALFFVIMLGFVASLIATLCRAIEANGKRTADAIDAINVRISCHWPITTKPPVDFGYQDCYPKDFDYGPAPIVPPNQDPGNPLSFLGL